MGWVVTKNKFGTDRAVQEVRPTNNYFKNRQEKVTVTSEWQDAESSKVTDVKSETEESENRERNKKCSPMKVKSNKNVRGGGVTPKIQKRPKKIK